MSLISLLNKKSPAPSLKEDRAKALILRANPESTESAAIKLERWNQLSYLERFIDLADIRKYKSLCEGPPVNLVYSVGGFNERQQKDLRTYCLNPAYYNSQLK